MTSRGPLVGFNDNVSHRGASFHVQTEDMGLRRRQITTHLFADGGRIVHTVRRPYEETADGATAAKVQACMKAQHRRVVEDLRGGAFDREIANSTVTEDGRGGYRFVAARPPQAAHRVQTSAVSPYELSSTKPSASSSEPPPSSADGALSDAPPRTMRGPELPELRADDVSAALLVVPSEAAPLEQTTPLLELVAGNVPPSSIPIELDHPSTLRGLGATADRTGAPARRSRPPRFGEAHAPGRRLDQLVSDNLLRKRGG